ncbi:hypothetical protein EUTSA_v10002939mg [Eutrema salsugineum]|uniref:F-box associated beta-propeller type 1 domain-containing protein n=1 Tax=Eutrema salsugineum TaxID=72664 RepID=V4LBC0_EUTSA|nr:hypothetical protein EUTSA_v10002939mg [Eutrema salsugineum]
MGELIGVNDVSKEDFKLKGENVGSLILYKDALSLKGSHSNSKQVDIAKIFHCNGLLLCITDDNRLVVWNPCLGEIRCIQHKNSYDRDCSFALGYENNQYCRSYKTLMFWRAYQNTNKPVRGFKIYEFSSDSWRVVNVPRCIGFRYSNVTLKGNTYWISYDEIDKDDEYLLSFDFTQERDLDIFVFPHLRIVEEQLSVLIQKFDTSVVEMWVTKKLDSEAELPWSKSFTVDLGSTHSDRVHPFTSLLIEGEKKVALCCDSILYRNYGDVVYTIGEDDDYYTETPYIKEPWFCSRSWWPFIFSYVPSLFPIVTQSIQQYKLGHDNVERVMRFGLCFISTIRSTSATASETLPSRQNPKDMIFLVNQTALENFTVK